MTPGQDSETSADLVASRARILARSDEHRRALQRDLHDGAQQRLVHAVIALTMIRDVTEPGSAAAGLVEEALVNVRRASSDLREVVHRLLPRSLTYGGLRTGLQSLVADLPVAVELSVGVPRLPPQLETTAYLVTSDMVGTVVGRAGVRRIVLDVGLTGESLTIEIRDDAAGGAWPGVDDGLAAARDRVDAAGGRLRVTDLPGGGQVLRAELPVPPGVDRTTG